MEWIWNKRNDKTIKKLLKAIKKGKEATDNFDFIASVRSGELCFDLIFREWDEDDYRLSTDLYVTGEKKAMEKVKMVKHMISLEMQAIA